MDWNEARQRLLAEKNYTEVGKATGLHPNGIRRYAMGITLPRYDNAQKVIEYLSNHERRQTPDRRKQS